LIIGLVGARLYLPIWLKDYVNQQLNAIPGYQGSVDDIEVHLYRGAYVIEGLKLMKLNAGIPVPFLAIDTTDLSLQWGALIHGRVVSDVHMTHPVLNFAVSPSGTKAQTGTETDWNAPIKKLMPIDINVVELFDGKVTYRDFSTNPKVDIFINRLNGKVNNLRNVVDKGNPLPSTMDITGDSIGDGKLHLKGRMNVLTRYVDMDMDFALENAKLTAFNSFSDAYGAIRFKQGTMDIYSEFAVKDARVTGYVKPLIHHLSVDRIPKDTNPLEMAWSALASVLLEIFENQPHDQLATKVPLEGRIDNVETPFWPTLGGVLRNAFVKAFRKGTDNEVNFGGTHEKTEKAQ
jgi:hypothetical protein